MGLTAGFMKNLSGSTALSKKPEPPIPLSKKGECRFGEAVVLTSAVFILEEFQKEALDPLTGFTLNTHYGDERYVLKANPSLPLISTAAQLCVKPITRTVSPLFNQ